MTQHASAALRERLARLDADQLARLVTGLQQRIDDLRAAQQPEQASQIAIVGLACRFPGASDAAAFRRLLSEGRNAVGPVPPGRPEGAALPPGGYIEDIDRYDAAFFGMRDSEAAHMDPQHRLMLEVAWHALEDAGAADPQRRPRATGVFLGISTHDYEARFHGAGPGFTPLATTGNAASAAAGRLAHLLDITGPALSLDTACSSSLVAVHAACRSLRLGECDMAIAGGVNLLVGDELTRGFAAAGMLSPSHACHTFDASADGYVRGEGAGFVVLKRLADAQRDGDRIRAIVRGGAVNHDGRASSLTAPNASAQVALVRSALADAGLQPEEVQVVECHGTGTPLGDPIEVQALAESYGAGRREPLLLGAVKTNIGHLEAAAGIAGLIKLVLSLESATLAPTLHQSSPNPRIAWDRLPLRVIDREQDWPAAGPRRAGVSSFGFSGTNAHLILEAASASASASAPALGEACAHVPGGTHAAAAAGAGVADASGSEVSRAATDRAPESPPVCGPVVLPLAAPDEQGLERLAATLAAWLEESGADLRLAAASMAMGRSHHAVRAAAVAADVPAMVAALGEIAAGGAPAGGARGNAAKTAPRIAFLYTGQGSQWLGMGRDLYEEDAIFRAAIDRCAQVVDPLIGRSLAAAMFFEGPAEDLADTRLAQPALFALEYALAERLAAWGVEPDVSIGHSLGEWVAACRSGVFGLDDALRLVVERGRVMATAAAGGAMAAVFAGLQALDQLPADLREGIDLAAVNAPDECVVSGPAAAIEAACEVLDGLGIGTQRLRTTQAFHSRLMEPALGAFAAALEGVPLAAPARVVVSNLTGTAQAAFATADYWVRHIREPVRFAQGMAAVADTGATVLIEIGASPALTGTASRCPGFEGRGAVFFSTLRRNQPARRTLGTLLAQLFVAGVPLRWDAVFGPARRIDVPGYPFADRRHWLQAPAGSGVGAFAQVAGSGVAADAVQSLAQAGLAGGFSAGAQAARGMQAQAAGQNAAQARIDVDPREQIAAMLARSLQLSAADAQSDRSFLELGVDSLALTEAVAALERRWSIVIPRRALFETLATPLRLTEHVLEAGAQAAGSASSAAAPSGAGVTQAAAPAFTAAAAPLSAAVAGGAGTMPQAGIAGASAVVATVPQAAAAPAASVAASIAAAAQAAHASARPAAPAMSPQALAGLDSFSRAYIQRSRGSRGQRLEFGPYLADSRAVAGFRPETKGMLYPIVGAQASGSHLTDIDGNHYVDIAMGFGVQLFGHSPEFITEAIARHIAERGMFIGPQAHLAGEVAQRICRLTGNERAAFCNSGTEAVMSALRLARHATGRQRIAMFQGSYHGHFDGTLAQVGPGGASVPLAGGTPPAMVGDVLLLDYGDEQGSLEIVAREAPSLAAVIVEPVQGRRPDRQPREFLQRLRAITQALGVPLIFDEVLLGFRVGLGGAQAWAGVRADLVTYGKIVGGGLPIGVVAGQARYLDALDGGAWPLDGPGAPRDARTFFAGTFNKNPLAMAAARSVLEHLEAAGPELQETLNRRTADFAARLNAVLAQEQAGISVHHFASLFRFIGASDLFYNQMIQHGVYVWEGRTCFLSTAHSDADLDLIEGAVRDSVRDMRAAGMLGGAPAPARASAAASASAAAAASVAMTAAAAARMPAAGASIDAPAATAAAHGLASASAHADEEILPTTAGQQALRLLAAFSPQTSAAYNQSLVLDFQGELDTAALDAALCEVVRRHEALRSTFPEDGAELVVHRELPPRVLVLDRQNADEAALRAWISQAVLAPFDLERGPLVAAWLLRLAADRYRLVLAMPHLITDGWSMQAMALELAEIYSAAREGRAAELSEPVPYRRYAEHTRARAGLPEVAAYWRSVYSTVPPALELPADRPRPALQGYAGARVVRRLPVQLKQALESYGRRAGGSLFAVCLAAYGRMLARLSGQDDLAVAIFSAGQAELGASALLGYCVGVLPLRIAAGADVADDALLAAAQRGVAQGMAHRDYPYARLLKDLNLRRDPSRPPLASVSFNLDRMDAPPRFAGLDVSVDANAHGAVRWDLNWNMTADADGLCVEAHYNRDLFDAARVEQWLDLYAGILEALAAPPQSGPGGGAGMRAAGTAASGFVAAAASSSPLARTAADAGAAAPEGAGIGAGVETLAQRVARHAAQTPAAAAVRDAQGIVDYAGLDAMALALAVRLAQAGVGAGDRVAFRLPRSLGPVVAILAAMRLGAAFVPLDEDHPDSHHAYVLEDSGAKAIVVEAGTGSPLPSVPAVAWERASEASASELPTMLPPAAAAADTAYVLYTSGSTGRPKGVIVPQGAVAAYVQAMLGRLGLQGPLSCAIVSSFAADLGYTSVLAALWSGGALHAVDAETARDPAALQQWMARMPVDVMKIVPAHLAALLDAPGAAALLPRKALILGGDVLSWKLVERIHGLGAACRVFNHYGPTETTVGACMTEAAAALRADGEHAVPIGQPLDGYAVALIGADGMPVADGAEGEIVISGPAVASGYTRPEAAGAERFGSDEHGLRRYRTGDLARRRPDGAILFLGRGDDMVKIRGHRIEPAGLAELLRACPGVRDAVVLVEHHEGREPALLAVVAGEAEAGAALAWLARQVPAAMVPARIMVREAMPLTPNGKIDRQALLAAAPGLAVSAAAAASGSGGAPLESVPQAAPAGAADPRVAALLEIWRAVLQRDEIGPDDDFFALGGDSIMAIQIVGRARAVGLALTPTQVFQAPTPRGLAALAVSAAGVAGAEPLAGPVPLTPIQHWLRETAMPDRNRWCLSAVFQAPSTIEAPALRAVLDAMIERHDALRTAVDLVGSTACQQVRAASAPTLCVRDASALEAAELPAAQDRLADELMGALDLAAGRVLAAGALNLGAGRGAQIVLAVHHAVSDVVSWAVLAEDLEAGLAGGPAALRGAGTSWSWWAQALSQRVQAEEVHLAYWSRIARRAAGCTVIPVDDATQSNCEGDVREQRLCVPAEPAVQFLEGMASVFGLRAHEAVLAAVGLALAAWAGQAVALDLEGHGRQPFDAAIDLSRTVGWFTTRYPVVLPDADASRLDDWLPALKETLREIPGHGMSYGVLRYGGHEELRVDPDVSFNYVGELGQFGGGDLALLRLGAGRERGADAARRHLLAFDGWQDDEGLWLSCRHAARHGEATVAGLLESIREELMRLTAACAASATAVYTPADFTGMEFSQGELDQLMGELGDVGLED